MNTAEIDQFLYSRQAETLGNRLFLAQAEVENVQDSARWLKLGGEDGENVTLEKIPTFLNCEREKLQRELVSTKQIAAPQAYAEVLREEFNLLIKVGDFNTPEEKDAAKEYFKRSLAGAWYQFKHHPYMALIGYSELDYTWIKVKSSTKALQLI